jgi:hypothetical protein
MIAKALIFFSLRKQQTFLSDNNKPCNMPQGQNPGLPTV